MPANNTSHWFFSALTQKQQFKENKTEVEAHLKNPNASEVIFHSTCSIWLQPKWNVKYVLADLQAVAK